MSSLLKRMSLFPGEITNTMIESITDSTKNAEYSKPRILEVTVIEARGLSNMSKKEGERICDPYVTIHMIDLGQREIKSENYCTSVKHQTLSPNWENETFQFGKHFSLQSEIDLPTLKFAVYHKPAFAVTETPLGVSTYEIDLIDQNGAEFNSWLPLEPIGRLKSATGEIHVKIKFLSPLVVKERSLSQSGYDDTESSEYEKFPPNQLLVKILKAKNLGSTSSFGSINPQVKLKIAGYESKRTKVIKKSLNPVWNEDFIYEITDPELVLDLSMKDYNGVRQNGHLGEVIISLAKYENKKCITEWIKLRNNLNNFDGIERGEVLISILWRYSKEVDKQSKVVKQNETRQNLFQKIGENIKLIGSGLDSVLKGQHVEEDSEVESDNNSGDDVDTKLIVVSKDDIKDKEEIERVLAEKEKVIEEEKKQMMSKLLEIDIEEGDYQIQVHIIEVRDLAAKKLDGTSDPIVFIETFNQKQHTSTVYGVASCVFDELNIFNIKDVDKETFEQEQLTISVYDATSNPLAKQVLIGKYTFDVSEIYSSNINHELYRRWVVLMDDSIGSNDIGVRGYLKLSIQIIGPGEKIKLHDDALEIKKEQALESSVGGDISIIAMYPPVISSSYKYVVVSVYKCEGLPVMDGQIGNSLVVIEKAKTDAFCQLSYAKGKPIRTHIKTVYGNSPESLNPTFLTELWYPVSVPAMTDQIDFSIWDWDLDFNELIGVIKYKLSKCCTDCENIRWYNLYGAPEFKQGNALQNINKARRAVVHAAEIAAGVRINYHDHYNLAPDVASTYKGRALVKFRVEDERPKKYCTPEIMPFKRKLKPLAKSLIPKEKKYTFSALVISGMELPKFYQYSLSGVASHKAQSLRLKVCIGNNSLCTKPAKHEEGLCRWNELLESTVILPADVQQLPDIFIYLLREDDHAVCFTRLKSYDLETKKVFGFNVPMKWYNLKEDKSIDDLAEDDFPGSVLLEIGFSPFDENNTNPLPIKLLKAKASRNFQVRVHIYQCKDVTPSDSNGLADPYIRVSLMGQFKNTSTKRCTLFPSYYETLVFDDIAISDADNFDYASQVSFRLFDHDDFSRDSFLGYCSIPLKDALLTEDPDETLPDPKWFEFGNNEGYLLAQLQIIPTIGNKLAPPKSIIPDCKDAYIEIIAVGIRDMAPFLFQSMQNPYLELEIESFGTRYKATTKKSKKPDPSNPNFLEKLVIQCKLPINSIFASSIQLRAKDSRLGGFSNPGVGVGFIDIMSKIPWCSNTYIPPFQQKFNDFFETQCQECIETSQIEKLSRKHKDNADNDDFIATQHTGNLSKFIEEKINAVDTGAGIFGALKHINLDGYENKLKSEFGNFNDDNDEEDPLPAWSINRPKLEGSLEEHFQTSPFETYNLTRGQKDSGIFSKLKVVGKFKGFVRVMESLNEPKVYPEKLMDMLMKPRKYKLRLYCLKAYSLACMDKDFFGAVAKSDPYLKVNIGKFKFSDRNNAEENATDVDLYKAIEIDVELPGTSQLKITMMDKDNFGEISDDVIGSTTIDLEDRLFDNRWQEMGREEIERSEYRRWAIKPIESRTIHISSNKFSQGTIDCWIDILTAEEASSFPVDNVALKPKEIFEVRVIIWKSKDVPPMDTLEGMSDLFVKCWPESCKEQETDTHWRCKKGKASWNYRLLFDVELGHNTRAMKFPYLYFQLWDRDILKWNDCAGEGTINLGPYYKKAYKNSVCLKLFEAKKGAALKRHLKHEKRLGKPINYDKNNLIDNKDIPIEEDGAESCNYDDDGENVKYMNNPLSNSTLSPNSYNNLSSNLENKATWGNWIKSKVGLSRGYDDDTKSLLNDDDDENDEEFTTEEDESKKEDDEDAKEMVDMIKGMTGVFDDDPPDSAWINFEKKGKNGEPPEPMGSVSYSIQIWPKEKSILMPVGHARNDPNNNPYLPPPSGRLKFTLNPFAMGSQLCGPALCAKFSCCLFCTAFLLLSLFCQPVLNIIINILFLCI